MIHRREKIFRRGLDSFGVGAGSLGEGASFLVCAATEDDISRLAVPPLVSPRTVVASRQFVFLLHLVLCSLRSMCKVCLSRCHVGTSPHKTPAIVGDSVSISLGDESSGHRAGCGDRVLLAFA